MFEFLFNIVYILNSISLACISSLPITLSIYLKAHVTMVSIAILEDPMFNSFYIYVVSLEYYLGISMWPHK